MTELTQIETLEQTIERLERNRDAWKVIAGWDRARLDAIERMGPNGTLRIDDERGLCPRYIHWGGSTGLTLREAIDKAKEPPSTPSPAPKE